MAFKHKLLDSWAASKLPGETVVSYVATATNVGTTPISPPGVTVSSSVMTGPTPAAS